MDIHNLHSNLYDTIIGIVVTGEDSPYGKMMRKTRDIDIDFFETIFRGIYTLSEELNLELKDKVINVFEKMADSYYKGSDFESQLLNMIQNEAEKIKSNVGDGSVKSFLSGLADNLECYAKGTNMFAGVSKYTYADVESLYKDAKHITLIEFFSGGNSKDILSFYEALMDYTWWKCREVVVERTEMFLMAMAAKTRKMIRDNFENEKCN